jgi:hypothetical protein
VLPPETDRIWTFLKEQPSLSGFVLIGGTALALQIAHRRSEDLDLAYPVLPAAGAVSTVIAMKGSVCVVAETEPLH